MSSHCEIEEENKRLKEENKQLREKYHNAEIKAIEQKHIELTYENVVLELPLCFRILMRLYKGEILHCVDKDKLRIWISSYWGRSWES